MRLKWMKYRRNKEETKEKSGASLNMINPFRSYIGPRPTVWFSSSVPMSEDVRQFLLRVRPLSVPVRRFFSCSTDFSQEIAQIVLFLNLHVFFCCRIITSNSQPLYRPKQIRAGEYAVGRKIGLERVNFKVYIWTIFIDILIKIEFIKVPIMCRRWLWRMKVFCVPKFRRKLLLPFWGRSLEG
jgi:hypothetical protein